MKKILIIILFLIIVLGLGGIVYLKTTKNTQPSITLISPNGGEILQKGSVYTIKWETQKIPTTDKVSINVRRVAPPPLPLEGQEFDPIIFIGLENTGSVEWTVAEMYPEGNYILGITSYASLPITEAAFSDESDATFQIINSPIAKVTYICNDDKTIDAAFYKGEQKLVESGEMPIPSGSVKIVLSDGRKFNLPQTISASGVRYANSDESFVFWSKGNGALVLENNVEKSYIGCVVLVKDPGGLPKVYSDGTVGFSIRYPADYSINTSYKYQALGPGKDISGVKFTIPAGITTGTNLSSFDTGVSVEIIPAIQNCNASLFLGGNINVQTVTDNNSEYSFASTSQGAAGNYYEENVWAIPGTNPCIAVRYLIHSTNIGNYPSGTVSEFDKNSLINQFDKIRHSLTAL